MFYEVFEIKRLKLEDDRVIYIKLITKDLPLFDWSLKPIQGYIAITVKEFLDYLSKQSAKAFRKSIKGTRGEPYTRFNHKGTFRL